MVDKGITILSLGLSVSTFLHQIRRPRLRLLDDMTFGGQIVHLPHQGKHPASSVEGGSNRPKRLHVHPLPNSAKPISPASNPGLHVHPLHMNTILPLSSKTRPLQRRARNLTDTHFGHLPLQAKPTLSSIVCLHNFGDIPIQANLPLSSVGCLDNLRARWTGQS